MEFAHEIGKTFAERRMLSTRQVVQPTGMIATDHYYYNFFFFAANPGW